MSRLSEFWRRHVERTWVRGTAPATLNEWQVAFVEWTAERLKISPEESLQRFRQSWAALRGGHGGRRFKLYAELCHDLHRPFASPTRAELLQAYQMHAPLHFLRMLSYPIPSWPGCLPDLEGLFDNNAPVLVDFGCGLAQKSISLARFLRTRGQEPRLFLAELPTPQLDFVRWFCARLNLSAEFFVCTASHPWPLPPAWDLCVALEVFEHLHDPLACWMALQVAARPGAYLWTNLGKHEEEFLHVSHDLGALRQRLAEQGWKELLPHRLYRDSRSSRDAAG